MIHLPKNARCYSYIRFSSSEQAKGDSYRRQFEASRNFAKKHSLILDESLTYKDLGVSAYKGHNISKGALGKFTQAVQDGKIKSNSILIVESIDRISRSTVLNALNIFTGLIDLGITIVTLQDNQIYSKASITDNWAQLIISITYMARAHEEIKTKTERVTEAWKNKATNLVPGQVYTSKTPMWIEIANGNFQLIPERAEVIKRIFDQYCSGYGYLLIAKELNAENIPSFKGKKWGTSSVKKVIHNRATFGAFTPKLKGHEFDEITDYFPAVISKDDFYKTQQIANSRLIGGQKVGKKKVNNLFAGIINCGYCGAAMSFIGRGTKKVNKTHPDLSNTLTCHKHRRGTGCFNNSFLYNDFEKNFLNFINEIDLKTVFERDDSVNDEIKALEGELVEKQKALKKIEEALEDADTVPKIFLKKANDLEHNIEALKTTIDLKTAEGQDRRAFNDNMDIYNYSTDVIKMIQAPTTELSTEDLFELRLQIKQAIQQVVAKVLIFSKGYIKGQHKLSDGFSPVPSYFVFFTNGEWREVYVGEDFDQAAMIVDSVDFQWG